MKRIVLIVALVLVAGGGAFFGYLQLTRLDRALDAMRSGEYLSPERYRYLAEHSENPEVLAFFRKELGRLGGECRRAFDLGWMVQDFDALDIVFTKHGAALGKSFIPEAVKFLSLCGDARVKKWIPRFASDPEVIEAILTQLEQDNLSRHGARVVLPDLLARGVVVSDRLVALLVHRALLAGGDLLRPLLQNGFPKNGAKLSKEADAAAPASDPRIHRAYAGSFIKMAATMNKYKQSNLEEISRVLSANPPPASEPYVRGLGWVVERYTDPAHNSKPVIPMARALGSAGVAMMRKIAQTPAKRTDRARWKSRAGVSKLLNVMGSGDATSLTAVLDGALNKRPSKKRSFFYDARKPVSRPPPAVADAVAGIVPMGTAAAPALRAGLDRNHWLVNEIVIRAWAAIDAGGLAQDLAVRLAAGWWDHAAVLIAVELLSRSPENDSRLAGFFFRVLSKGGKELSLKANHALGQRVAAVPLVDGIFTYLDRKSRYTARFVSDVFTLLSSKRGAAPALIKNLDRELEEAAGRPEAVFWLHKYLAISYLQNQGGEDALPLLEKLLADPSAFKNITTTWDRRSGRTLNTQAKVVRFSKLAGDAVAAIRRRSR